jgi:hypothetical protein
MVLNDQAFSLSYDLAPPPTPLRSASCLSFSFLLSVERSEGKEGKSYDVSKLGPSMNHSILSGWSPTREEGGESHVQPCSPRPGSEPAAARPTGCSSR